MKTKHQIITLGKENISVYHGLKEVRPDVVHFLLTDQTSECYERIVEQLEGECEWHTYRVDPYDGPSVERVCEKIQREHEGEVTYNLSEGTKIMTIAALNVARQCGAKALFLTQTGELVDLVTFESQPLQVTLSNEEMLRVSGSRLWTHENVKYMSRIDVRAASEIVEFIERNNDAFYRIQSYFRHACRRKVSCLPGKFRVGHDLRVTVSKGRIEVMRYDKMLLSLSHPNSAFLMFGGRWWEALVASQVKCWGESQGQGVEAWHSVVFQSEADQEKVKSEVDLLINNNSNLIFLECKSGHISQEDIYKIDSVREIYGGDSSIAALASYYPLEPMIREKCDNLDIHVFAPETRAEIRQHVKQLPDFLNTVSRALV